MGLAARALVVSTELRLPAAHPPKLTHPTTCGAPLKSAGPSKFPYLPRPTHFCPSQRWTARCGRCGCYRGQEWGRDGFVARVHGCMCGFLYPTLVIVLFSRRSTSQSF